MDKGKEKVTVEQLEGTNTLRFKRTKIEDDGQQKKENAIERAIREEDRLRKMKMDAAGASAGKEEEETKEDSIDLFLKQELEGTTTEGSTDEGKTTSSELVVYSKPVETVAVVSTSEEEEEETILSPKESSTNNPKGLKKNVEQPAQDETLSPEEALKNKQAIEEEDEWEEVLVDSLSDDTLSDACTRNKLPTSPPIDKFMDSDKDKSMRRSPPGDQAAGL